MTKQTIATTLLLLALAVLLVVPAAQPSLAETDDDTPAQKTTADIVTTPAPETTVAVTTVPAETAPPMPESVFFDEKVSSPYEALDLVQKHFFSNYTEKVADAGGDYHYSPKNLGNYILSVADSNVPYKITMAVTINDEPITSSVYYVTPDGERTFVGINIPDTDDSSEDVSDDGMEKTLPYTITDMDMEITSSDEALDLVQKFYAPAYTQRHSYETIGTYYTIPSNPKARLEVELVDGDLYVVHQYIEGSDEDDIRYAVTSKDGKTSVDAYNP